jgi:hypothetical protein
MSNYSLLIGISDPVYVKASKASAITDLKSGVVTVEQLRRTGDAFTNVTQVIEFIIHNLHGVCSCKSR